MRRITFIWGLFVSLVLMLSFGISYGFTLEDPLEKALLMGNWEEVFKRLQGGETRASDPVARLIMAHATLATNRNNASLMLFLSVKEEGGLKLWSEWTESLLGKHPENPVALYLSADTKVREGNLKEAKERFTKALNIKNDFALAFNARGVVQVLTNEWDNALMDFLQATEVAPNFADAYANLGTYWILKEAPEGALEAFNKAISINPEFALAYNGRGTAYFGKGEFEKAAEDFSIASQINPILVVSEINQGFAIAYASKLITLASMERKPGMTLEIINRQYSDILKQQQQKLLNMLPSQKDQKFWEKIDALPYLSNDKMQSLVKEYGVSKIQIAASLKKQESISQITQSYPKGLPFSDKLDFFNNVSSLALSSFREGKKDWKFFFDPQSSVSEKGTVMDHILKHYSSLPTTSNKDVTLYITDRGINQWRLGLKLGDDFKARPGVIDGIPRIGQILIPMPPDSDFQKMPDIELVQMYYKTIKEKIDEAFSNGTKVFELQMVQNIQFPGYFDPFRQKLVNRFGKIVYKAIGMVVDDLKAEGLSTLSYAILGSNGCKVFTENIEAWKPYMNKADLYDGRSFKTPTIETIKAIGQENIRFFNTRGDAPGLNIPIAHSISNFDVIKTIKKEHPGITVIHLDPIDRINFPGFGHIAGMDKNSKFLAKNLNPDGTFTAPKEMTGRDLLPNPGEKRINATSNFINAAKLQLIDKKLYPTIIDIYPFSSQKQPSYQIPGYYTSTNSKAAPGGISTEEIARSFVDKGNWPVMTSFGLFYNVGFFTEGQDEKGGK